MSSFQILESTRNKIFQIFRKFQAEKSMSIGTGPAFLLNDPDHKFLLRITKKKNFDKMDMAEFTEILSIMYDISTKDKENKDFTEYVNMADDILEDLADTQDYTVDELKRIIKISEDEWVELPLAIEMYEGNPTTSTSESSTRTSESTTQSDEVKGFTEPMMNDEDMMSKWNEIYNKDAYLKSQLLINNENIVNRIKPLEYLTQKQDIQRANRRKVESDKYIDDEFERAFKTSEMYNKQQYLTMQVRSNMLYGIPSESGIRSDDIFFTL